jgi:hypothetical protein
LPELGDQANSQEAELQEDELPPPTDAPRDLDSSLGGLMPEDDSFPLDDGPADAERTSPRPQVAPDELLPPDDDTTSPVDEGDEFGPSLPDLRDDFDLDQREARERSEEARERECRQSLQYLRNKRLSDISLDISVTGEPGTDYPRECDLETQTSTTSGLGVRDTVEITVAWTASGLCHKPLYFEETGLERYGHSTGPYLEPLFSSAHFFLTLPILPYKMGLKTPNECVYTLGHYRPGSCAPYLVPPVPLSVRAGLFQAGAVVGAAYLLP